jgi:hypothetical protein
MEKMRLRAIVTVTVVVAVVHVALVLGVWALRGRPTAVTPVTAAPPPPAASVASVAPEAPAVAAPTRGFERVAELFASSAFRSVITADYAALHELVRRATVWPEVTYVSIEGRDGKILAHTDPRYVGRPASELAGAVSRRGQGEITAPIVPAGNGKGPGAGIGNVRIGYLVEAAAAKEETAPAKVAGAVTTGDTPSARPAAPDGAKPEPEFPLAAMLALAAVAALPVGLVVVKLAGDRGVGFTVPPGEMMRVTSLEEAREALARTTAELEDVRGEHAERLSEVARLRADLDQATRQAAAVQSEITNRATELERLRTELRDRGAELLQLKTQTAQRQSEYQKEKTELDRERTELATELAQLRDEAGRRRLEHEKQTTELEHERTELATELAQLRDEAGRRRLEHEKQTTELERERTELAKELAQFKDEAGKRLLEHEQQTTELEHEREELAKELTRLSARLTKTNPELTNPTAKR